jgi:carboxymethylenebutenolidase
MAKTVTVDTADGPMSLYDAEPDTTPRGAVVVVQEAFGVNDHIEDVARRFAAEGFRAVSPHLFHRSGATALAYDDFQSVMPHMQALTREGLTADLDATLEYLAQAGFSPGSTAIVGYCMGGSVALYAASHYLLGAAATYYGGGVAQGRFGFPPLVDLAPGLKTPWIGFFGDLDQSIPVEDVEALRKAVTEAGVPTEIVRYEDAEHGFHCDARPSYNEAASRDAWSKTLDWFGEYLGES